MGKAEKSKRVLEVQQKSDEDANGAMARNVLRPSVQAAVTLEQVDKSKFGDLDLMSLVDSLGVQADLVTKGDLNRVEAMLAIQAHTLDAIFNRMVSHAVNADYMNKLATYMKLGLRAQSQCRATIEALGDMKNPSNVAFVKQANIANGPQQVNNGAEAKSTVSCMEKNKKPKNKLLSEKENGQKMDAGTASKTGRNDPEMETVEAINGTENG